MHRSKSKKALSPPCADRRREASCCTSPATSQRVVSSTPHAVHPLASGCLRCTLPKRRLNVGNRILVTGDHTNVLHARLARVRMRVDEAREHRFSAKIDFLAETGG